MGYIIETLPEIAKMVGRSDQTVRKWIRIHGFPAAKMPNGNWMTTPTLIDKWILARANQNEKLGAGKYNYPEKKDSARGTVNE